MLTQKFNGMILSIYRTWLDLYEDKIGETTLDGTIITGKLVNTIRSRYLVLLDRVKK